MNPTNNNPFKEFTKKKKDDLIPKWDVPTEAFMQPITYPAESVTTATPKILTPEEKEEQTKLKKASIEEIRLFPAKQTWDVLKKLGKGFENNVKYMGTLSEMMMTGYTPRTMAEHQKKLTSEELSKVNTALTKEAIEWTWYYDLTPKAVTGTLRNIIKGIKGRWKIPAKKRAEFGGKKRTMELETKKLKELAGGEKLAKAQERFELAKESGATRAEVEYSRRMLDKASEEAAMKFITEPTSEINKMIAKDWAVGMNKIFNYLDVASRPALHQQIKHTMPHVFDPTTTEFLRKGSETVRNAWVKHLARIVKTHKGFDVVDLIAEANRTFISPVIIAGKEWTFPTAEELVEKKPIGEIEKAPKGTLGKTGVEELGYDKAPEMSEEDKVFNEEFRKQVVEPIPEKPKPELPPEEMGGVSIVKGNKSNIRKIMVQGKESYVVSDFESNVWGYTDNIGEAQNIAEGIEKTSWATPTPNQVETINKIAKAKLFISREGKTHASYKRLMKNILGRTSLEDLTEAEADLFTTILKSSSLKVRIRKGYKIPPFVPTKTRLAKAGFFDRMFSEPTLIKYGTPSDRYAYALGVYDLLEPYIQGKINLILVRRDLHNWLERTGRKIDKIEKTTTREKVYKWVKGSWTRGREKWYNMLDRYATAEEAGLTGESATIFRELRKLTQDMLDRVNEVRMNVGLPIIPSLRAYVTHISDVFTHAKLREKYPFPETVKYWLRRIRPKHIYNPTAMKRMLADRKGLMRDPIQALKAMVSMDLKQIYLEYPNTIFREQMNALAAEGAQLKEVKTIPASTREWLDAYVNEVIKGHPTKLDNLTNKTLDKMFITSILDWMMKPFGRGLGINPIKQMTGVISRLVHDATIWGRLKLVVRNHTQKLLTLGLYDTKAFLKGMLPASKELNFRIKNSDFLRMSRAEFMEMLPRDIFGLTEKIGFMPYGHSHVSNVDFAQKVAWHAATELIVNPKYEKLGWTTDDRLKEMEFGANTTQYWYNLMGMPEIFRHVTLKPLTTLQSWWMNYTMKYWRELLHRAFTGKTGWGKPIPFKWRLGILRHIITSLIFIEGTRRALGWDYQRIALFGVLPTYMSPPGQIVFGVYNYIFARNNWEKTKAKNQIKYSIRAFIPGSMAWRDWMRAWENRNIEELFFYTGKKEPKVSFTPTTGSIEPGEYELPGKSTNPFEEFSKERK